MTINPRRNPLNINSKWQAEGQTYEGMDGRMSGLIHGSVDTNQKKY